MGRQNLIIIGARGWGREVYNLAQGSLGYGTDFVVKGFLDDKTEALEGMQGYPPILDSVENYAIQPDDVFVCALGEVQWKYHYADIVKKRGGQFINVVHASASIGRNTMLGHGCIVADNTSISCDVKIGDFVTIQARAIVGHDCRIEDWSHLGTGCFLGGGVVMQTASIVQTMGIVLPHVVLEQDAKVGAGSVAIRRVHSGTTVFGVPAQPLSF